MPGIAADQLVELAAPEPSAVVRARITTAWDLARGRNGGPVNAKLNGVTLMRVCRLDTPARTTIKELAGALGLTGRGVHRMLRVARTIADLQGGPRVGRDDILAASSLRDASLEVGVTA